MKIFQNQKIFFFPQSVLQQASSVLPGEKNGLEDGHSVAGQVALNKKQGVSGQSGQAAQNVKIDKHHKDFHCKTLIKEAIQDNDFLKNLSSSQVRILCVAPSQSLTVRDLCLDPGADGCDAREEDPEGLLRYQRR